MINPNLILLISATLQLLSIWPDLVIISADVESGKKRQEVVESPENKSRGGYLAAISRPSRVHLAPVLFSRLSRELPTHTFRCRCPLLVFSFRIFPTSENLATQGNWVWRMIRADFPKERERRVTWPYPSPPERTWPVPAVVSPLFSPITPVPTGYMSKCISPKSKLYFSYIQLHMVSLDKVWGACFCKLEADSVKR